MKKSLYLILLTLFMAQMPSESMAMERKRHREEISGDEISGKSEALREELERKKRAEESEYRFASRTISQSKKSTYQT